MIRRKQRGAPATGLPFSFGGAGDPRAVCCGRACGRAARLHCRDQAGHLAEHWPGIGRDFHAIRRHCIALHENFKTFLSHVAVLPKFGPNLGNRRRALSNVLDSLCKSGNNAAIVLGQRAGRQRSAASAQSCRRASLAHLWQWHQSAGHQRSVASVQAGRRGNAALKACQLPGAPA